MSRFNTAPGEARLTRRPYTGIPANNLPRRRPNFRRPKRPSSAQVSARRLQCEEERLEQDKDPDENALQ